MFGSVKFPIHRQESGLVTFSTSSLTPVTVTGLTTSISIEEARFVVRVGIFAIDAGGVNEISVGDSTGSFDARLNLERDTGPGFASPTLLTTLRYRFTGGSGATALHLPPPGVVWAESVSVGTFYYRFQTFVSAGTSTISFSRVKLVLEIIS